MTPDPKERGPVEESLDAFARLRASISIDETVMRRVRAAAAERKTGRAFGQRQDVVIGGAAAAGMMGEALALGLATFLVCPPLLSLIAPLGISQTSARFGSELLLALVNVVLVLGNAAGTVASSLRWLLPPAWTVAAAFMGTVLLLTFTAVRRDLHGSAEINERGSR